MPLKGEGRMRRLLVSGRTLLRRGRCSRRVRVAAVLALAVAPAAALATPAPGTWRLLPKAPIAPREGLSSVWTGKEMLLFGRVTRQDKNGAFLGRTTVAAAYDPTANSWRRLPSPGPTNGFMETSAVWTGKEMLVWGQGTRLAFKPTTNRWRTLPSSKLLAIHDGFRLVVWTGRELIGWGGGCCGDAFSDGVAYNPATNRWRAMARSPLAGAQHPVGAWTGRELIVFVSGFDPDGKPWPAKLARAAAYNPATNAWRQIAQLPEARNGATAVWDGREVVVLGGAGDPKGGKPGVLAPAGFAYSPTTNRWRRLAPMEAGRTGFATVWTGKRLLLWGGTSRADPPVIPPHGLAYDPKTDSWSPLPQAPLLGRLDPTAVWTGKAVILWGGQRPKLPLGTGTRFFADGAAFTPTT